MQLVGQSPEAALTSALAAVKFLLQQDALEAQVVQQQQESKMAATNQKFQKKLQEIYNGYKAVSAHCWLLACQCHTHMITDQMRQCRFMLHRNFEGTEAHCDIPTMTILRTCVYTGPHAAMLMRTGKTQV